MAQVIFIISLLCSGIFFYMLWTRPLAILCWIAILVFIIIGFSGFKTDVSQKVDFGKLASENVLLIARLLLISGIGVFLYYINLSILDIIFYFILINFLLFIWSHFINYSDGKKVFHISYFISLFFLFFLFSDQIRTSELIFIFASLVPFHLAIYTFIIFVVWIIHKPSNIVLDYSYLLFHLSVIIAIFFNKEKITLYNIIIAQLYLTLIYYVNTYIKKLKEKQIKEKKTITAEDILEWKTISEIKKYKKDDIYYDMIYKYYKLLESISNFSYEVLYFANTAIMIFMIWFYIKFIFKINPTSIDQLFYWFCIILFFINFIITKKYSQKTIFLHKIIAFVVVNFAIYVNLIYMLWTDKINIIVAIVIIRNYMNSILISQTRKVFKNIFFRQDYWYWIWANMLSLIANIILLVYTNIPNQLVFAIICVYLGSFVFLTYYNINFVYNEISSE